MIHNRQLPRFDPGERLFDGLAGVDIALEQVRVVDAPGVTHIKYRVAR